MEAELLIHFMYFAKAFSSSNENGWINTSRVIFVTKIGSFLESSENDAALSALYYLKTLTEKEDWRQKTVTANKEV